MIHTFPPGGIIENAARLFNRSIQEFSNELLYSAYQFPIDDTGKELVKLIPGHTVKGDVGPRKCDVLVLGKMPNQQESNMHAYFAGAIGDLWIPYLREKGINPDDWFLYHVCPFKIPDYLAGKSGIKKKYLNETMPLLEMVYNIVKPKLVLIFGSDALAAMHCLFDPKAKAPKVTDSRGTILTLADGTKAICTNSPNAVVREPETINEFRKDIDLLCQFLETGEHRNKATCSFTVLSTQSQLDEYIASNIDKTAFSLDTEWGAKQTLRTIQLATSKDQAVVINIHSAGMIPTELGSSFDLTIKKLELLLKRPEVAIYGHNGRGDVKILRKHGLDLAKQFIDNGFDTLLSYHLIPGNETLDKTLEIVAVNYLGIDRYDKPLSDWLVANKVGDAELELNGYGNVPDEILHPYGAMDAAVTFHLTEIIKVKLSQYKGLEELYYKRCHQLNWPILEMEEEGLLVDQTRLKSMTKLFENKRAELRKELQRKVGWEDTEVEVRKTYKNGKEKITTVSYEGFNPDSPDHVKEIVFGRFKKKNNVAVRLSPPNVQLLNLTPIKSTDSSGGIPWETVIAKNKADVYEPSTDSETMGILASEHPLCKDIQQYKFIAQICKNFLRPFVETEDGKTVYDSGIGGSINLDTGYAHTTFRTTLETGRYGTSPNFANFPKKQEKEINAIFMKDGKLPPELKSIKSVMIAEPGWVLLEPDWNQAELWTLGAVAKDEKFLNVLRTTDLHTYNLKKMFAEVVYKGKKIADYTIEEINKLRKGDKWLEGLRTSSKSVSFGIPYGRGPTALVREVKKEGVVATAEECKRWVNAFNSEYTDIHAFLQSCKEAVISPGYLQNPWGRYRAFPSCTDDAILAGMQREALNFNIQSCVADAMTQCLINFYYYRQINPSAVYKLKMSIHDAVLLACPVNMVERMIEEVIPFCMCEACEVPGIGLKYGLGDIDVSIRWGEKPNPQELLDIGVPRKYCGFKE